MAPPHLLPLLLGRLVVSGDLRRIVPLLPSHPHIAAALSSLYFLLFPSSCTFLHNLLIRASAASPSPRLAFAAFSSILRSGDIPDRFTFPSLRKSDRFTFPYLLKSASKLASFPRTGAQVHAQAVQRGFLVDVFVVNALLAMYAALRDAESMWEVLDSCAGVNAQQSGCHVLISDIYAAAGKWGEVLDARRVLQKCSIRKLSGSSSSMQ